MKAALRQQVRASVRAITTEQRNQLSLQLCPILESQTIWKRASRILGYAALHDEPDCQALISAALAAGKIVHLPRFEPTTGHYTACAFATWNELLPGRFGILEPALSCPPIALNQLDFVLVPGIAFDLSGRRLGRGKGFYDRMLAEVRGHKCGVCFDPQVVAAVPEEPHDIRVDSILTPTRWQLCPRAV